MADAFHVNTTDLRADATAWEGWAEQIREAGTAVPQWGVGLEPLDFSVLPGAPGVARAFQNAAQTLADQLARGAEQFEGVASKLTDVATRYEEAEATNVATVNNVEGVWI